MLYMCSLPGKNGITDWLIKKSSQKIKFIAFDYYITLNAGTDLNITPRLRTFEIICRQLLLYASFR